MKSPKSCTTLAPSSTRCAGSTPRIIKIKPMKPEVRNHNVKLLSFDITSLRVITLETLGIWSAICCCMDIVSFLNIFFVFIKSVFPPGQNLSVPSLNWLGNLLSLETRSVKPRIVWLFRENSPNQQRLFGLKSGCGNLLKKLAEFCLNIN